MDETSELGFSFTGVFDEFGSVKERKDELDEGREGGGELELESERKRGLT